MRELILGGQKSGKSRAAEGRALKWLAVAGREATLVATARGDDAEMTARIARHREERRLRVPGLATVERSTALATTLLTVSAPHRLVVVDCLTLWLTQIALPHGQPPSADQFIQAEIDVLLHAVESARGPLVLVSNEIGSGVAPLSADARRFVDFLGSLHQRLAKRCERVTLMVAGCELAVRGVTP